MTFEEFKDWMELLSYLVTVVGLPFAIVVFIMEQRRERANEEEDIFQKLSDDYGKFMELALQNADLQLLKNNSTENLTPEQQERMFVLFSILTSLFERAYVLVYEDDPNDKQLRMWKSWEDFMREWCRREDYRRALPQLLKGEDPDFAETITRYALEEESALRQIGSTVLQLR